MSQASNVLYIIRLYHVWRCFCSKRPGIWYFLTIIRWRSFPPSLHWVRDPESRALRLRHAHLHLHAHAVHAAGAAKVVLLLGEEN